MASFQDSMDGGLVVNSRGAYDGGYYGGNRFTDVLAGVPFAETVSGWAGDSLSQSAAGGLIIVLVLLFLFYYGASLVSMFSGFENAPGRLYGTSGAAMRFGTAAWGRSARPRMCRIADAPRAGAAPPAVVRGVRRRVEHARRARAR